MTTTSTLRKTLDRKQAEMCTPCPVATATGTAIIASRSSAAIPCPDGIALLVTGVSAIYQQRA